MVANARPAPLACLHCGTPTSSGDRFCCRGCEEVYALLRGAGLERYYDLGGGTGHPIVRGASDRKWLEPLAARLAAQPGLTRATLDVQGVHCAACVWLIDELFRREPGSEAIEIDPAVGAITLAVSPAFPIARWVDAVESFGYMLGPHVKRADERRSDVVWRMGVCIAIAMNAMIFGVAIYAGLTEGPVHRLFQGLVFALSAASVAIGGPIFFRSAWQSLKKRVLHLDVPIALGIVLAFGSSALSYLARGGATSYFDTISVFIALMLVGRFLQERVLAKNRAYLLASDGAEGLLARRISGTRVELVRCTSIEAGDRLLLATQDLVPVDATLEDERATFSLDWINGEAEPRDFRRGDIVPAGAFSRDARTVVVRADGAFAASTILPLLRASSRRDADAARATPWHARLGRIYVATVLAIAASAFVGWLVATGDLVRTLDVVAAVLIVTCPCAFGIATPLAYELAQAGLRRVGLFVRTPGFLDRATGVRAIVFDKTGTLTTGALTVTNPDALEALAPRDRAALASMVALSTHPKSRAIADVLASRGPFDPDADVREIPGAGLELRTNYRVYRLGTASFAAPGTDAATVFARDGKVLATIETGEDLRRDARDEIAALERDGYATFILSGDSPDATARMARACGVPEERAFAARTPEGKAAWLRDHDGAHALFVGDGINDSLAAEEALCAGTPAIDRPFMASRCDFYFVAAGLRPVRAALSVAKRLARVVRANLAIALLYNLVTVSLALAGLMTPLACAVLMPASSLSTVLATAALMRRPAWKS